MMSSKAKVPVLFASPETVTSRVRRHFGKGGWIALVCSELAKVVVLGNDIFRRNFVVFLQPALAMVGNAQLANSPNSLL